MIWRKPHLAHSLLTKAYLSIGFIILLITLLPNRKISHKVHSIMILFVLLYCFGCFAFLVILNQPTGDSVTTSHQICKCFFSTTKLPWLRVHKDPSTYAITVKLTDLVCCTNYKYCVFKTYVFSLYSMCTGGLQMSTWHSKRTYIAQTLHTLHSKCQPFKWFQQRENTLWSECVFVLYL